MIRYKYKIIPIPGSYLSQPNGKEKYFEDIQNDGWELVGPDYTRTNYNGNTQFSTQYYIFRKEIINFNKETII